MKKRLSLVLIALSFVTTIETKAATLRADNEPGTYVETNQKMRKHPRLLLLKGEEKKLLRDIKKDSIWTRVHLSIIDASDQISKQPYNLLQRKMEGRRLLSISRTALRRIFFTSYAYRTTKDTKYRDYAKTVMLNVCQFSDWNPNHFLDVAEMTLAVSIGYDWLYNELTPTERHIIEQAIIEKGLKPSFDNHFNIRGDNNWNQVCHTGMSFGAIAIWEQEKELCANIVNRAIWGEPYAMKAYDPDGVYPEGPGYWEYGTSFNVLFIEAIRQNFESDFGLTKIPGFMKTGEYITHMCTPGLGCFNYSDNGNGSAATSTAFWFYRETRDHNILFNQMRILHRRNPESLSRDRLAPAALIYGHDFSLTMPEQPKRLAWTGDGINPVYVTRSGWGYNDAFMAIKAGTPKANHAHMDVGSFIYESHGVRWALDLGTENYNNLEQANLSIWNMKQNSDRWTIYRYNNYNHNTLTFDDQLQVVNGRVDFKERKVEYPGYASLDLSPIYEEQVKNVTRRCELNGMDNLKVTDHIETLNKSTKLIWTMMTEAMVSVMDNQRIKLTKGDYSLTLCIQGANGKWFVENASPLRSVESENKGITRIHFVARLGRNSSTDLVATLNK